METMINWYDSFVKISDVYNHYFAEMNVQNMNISWDHRLGYVLVQGGIPTQLAYDRKYLICYKRNTILHEKQNDLQDEACCNCMYWVFSYWDTHINELKIQYFRRDHVATSDRKVAMEHSRMKEGRSWDQGNVCSIR